MEIRLPCLTAEYEFTCWDAPQETKKNVNDMQLNGISRLNNGHKQNDNDFVMWKRDLDIGCSLSETVS